MPGSTATIVPTKIPSLQLGGKRARTLSKRRTKCLVALDSLILRKVVTPLIRLELLLLEDLAELKTLGSEEVQLQEVLMEAIST